MNKSAILLIIAVLFTMMIGVVVVKIIHRRQEHVQIHNPNIGKDFAVVEMRVITGNEFSAKLQDGRNVHAFLDVKVIPEATKVLIEKLNNVSSSRLLCKGQLENGWLVDILIEECSGASCRQVSLVQWVKDQKLAWE